MDEDNGNRYRILPLPEGTAMAVAAGLHPGVVRLIEEMDHPGTWSYPRLLKGEEKIHGND